MTAGKMGFVDIVERMRSDWNRRAKEDAYFYAAFAKRQQSDEEFFASASDTIPTLEKEFFRLPAASREERRALEIGCGPGRLMGPMSRHFGEIHGVDISQEMIALAAERLRSIPGARLHVTPGSDLKMFAGDSFDYAYSYTVFQHIPSRDVVLGYLRESRRVLKPGGILCCQLRGTPPLQTEMERELETWTGCHFSRDEMLAFAREHDFQLVAISGLETQYMWTTWRKPLPGVRDFSRAELKNATISSGSERQVPLRGSEACVGLWIDGLPANCDLSDFEARFGDVPQRGAFLAPVGPGGAGQLNARVPPGVPVGEVAVTLLAGGQPIPGRCVIQIVPAHMQPSIVTVTDAIHIGSKFRVETGGLKVTLEGVERPAEVSFHIQGREAEIVQTEYKDPILEKYEYSFYLPKKTLKGSVPLIIRIAGREMASVPIEIV